MAIQLSWLMTLRSGSYPVDSGSYPIDSGSSLSILKVLPSVVELLLSCRVALRLPRIKEFSHVITRLRLLIEYDIIFNLIVRVIFQKYH